MDYSVLVPNESVSVADCLAWAVTEFERADVFFGHGTDNSRDEAGQLLLFALGIGVDSEEEVTMEQTVDAASVDIFRQLVARRCNERLPVPYLTGEAWFAGLPFIVNPDVLIPRSPIAELIDTDYEPWVDSQQIVRVLDLCTGNGCIGIASALQLPRTQVDLVDISAEALAVATQNISRYQLADRVRAIQSDLFAALPKAGQYQLIVSNPPYVDASDFADMPAEYKHEPAMALASGEDGLDITRRILREAGDYLAERGVLIVEVGNSWEQLEAAFPAVPFTWLEFERGGHGVFVMTRDELRQYQSDFQAADTL